MFDRNIYKSESKVVAVTKEIEKTISPDKVSEMYDVVREEVEKNIVRSIHIQSNLMEGAALEINRKYDTRTTDYIIRFVLNGEEEIYRGSFTDSEMLMESRLYNKIESVYKDSVTHLLMKHTQREIPSLLKPTTR